MNKWKVIVSLLITIVTCIPLMGCASVPYKGVVDAVTYEYGKTHVYFHDGTRAVFGEKVDIVVGYEYKLIVRDKELISLIKVSGEQPK